MGKYSYDSSTTGLRRFSRTRFSPDGSTIYFSATHDDGREGLWWIPAGGGDATLAVAFDDPMLEVIGGYLTVGPENLYLTIAQHESDIRVVDLAW